MTFAPQPKPTPRVLTKQAIKRAEKQAEIVAYRHVTKRESGRCRVCANRARQHHHFPYRSLGGGSDVRQIVLLCDTCHSLAHAHALEFSGNADVPGQLIIERRR